MLITTPLLPFGFAVLAGVCIYAVSAHVFVSATTSQRRTHWLFAVVCVLVIVNGGTLALQRTESNWLEVQRIIIGGVCSMCIAFAWFIDAYADVRPRWPAIAISMAFGLLLLANWLLPYGVWFSAAPTIHPRFTPWGEQVLVVDDSQPDPWRGVFWAALIGLGIYCFAANLALFLRGQRRRPTVLLLALCAVTLTGVNDFLVSLNLSPLPILSFFGSTAFVILMSWELRYEVQQFNQRMQAVMDQVPAMVYVKDRRNRYIFVNRQFASRFAHHGRELLGHTDTELLPPASSEQQRQQEDAALRSDSPLTFEEQLEMNGELRTYLALKFSLGEPVPYAVAGVSADITERIRNEQALRASEARIRLLLDSTEQGIVGVDLNGHCTFANRAAARLLGYETTDAMQNVGVEALIRHHYVFGIAPTSTPIGHTLRKGERNHCPSAQGRRPDGSEFAIEYWSHPMRDEHKLTGAVISFSDISERKRINDAVRVLAEASPVQDSHAFFEYCVRVLASTYNATYAIVALLEERRLRTIAVCAHHMIADNFAYDVATAPCNEIIGSGARKLVINTLSAAYPHAWFAGQQLQSYLGSPLLSSDKQVIGVVAVLGQQPLQIGSTSESMLDVFAHRISIELDRKRVLDRLQELNESLEFRVAERTRELTHSNEELEAFSYSVSHDLRAPLATIAGFSNLLTEQVADDASKRYLQHISDNTRRMGQLIDALLSLARIKRVSLALTTVDLSRLAHDIVGKLREAEPQRRVNVKIAPQLRARADQALLASVLDNLLHNAWKYTAKVAEAHIEVGAVEGANETTFYVRDNGAGFDPQAAAHRLFQPFQRLHAQKEFPGTGVGLATVARIIQRHGGRIWAEGAPDAGACFYFTLPTSAAVASAGALG